MRWLALALVLLATPVWAQVPTPSQAQQTPPQITSLAIAIQQVRASTEMYIEWVQRQLDAKDARIKELEGKCGEACK